jgi:hypothetical protein
MNRLEGFSRLVQEGRALDESVSFARYVLFSGLCRLFDENPQDSPLKVDGAMLRWKAEDLQRAVTERYRLRDATCRLPESELATMHSKLDRIAGYLSRLTQAPAVAVNPINELKEPEVTGSMISFEVIPGGLNGEVNNDARSECGLEGKKRDNLPGATHSNVA